VVRDIVCTYCSETEKNRVDVSESFHISEKKRTRLRIYKYDTIFGDTIQHRACKISVQMISFLRIYP